MLQATFCKGWLLAVPLSLVAGGACLVANILLEHSLSLTGERSEEWFLVVSRSELQVTFSAQWLLPLRPPEPEARWLFPGEKELTCGLWTYLSL